MTYECTSRVMKPIPCTYQANALTATPIQLADGGHSNHYISNTSGQTGVLFSKVYNVYGSSELSAGNCMGFS